MAQTYASAGANAGGVATATFTFGDTEFNDVTTVLSRSLTTLVKALLLQSAMIIRHH